MKQVDGHKSKCVARSYLDAWDHPDSCRKRTQKKSQSFLVSKSSENPEFSSSYYSSPTCCYKPQRNASIRDSDDAPYLQRDVSRSKPNREKHCSGCTSRKHHYDDELRNVDSFEFTDDKLGGLAGGHVVEDVEEEVAEDDREVELAEFLNNDYEQREELDETDEIDDESDRSPQTQRPRSRRGSKPEATALLTQQQRCWRGAVQQPDTRKFRCQQRVAALQSHHLPSSRYYHGVAEPEETEPLSEEDFVRTSPRRQPADYRQWSSSRNEPDRYDEADVATSMQSTRRARTKPAVDRLTEPELNGTRRCDRCGSLSSSKSGPPLKNTCRFDDCASIPIKGPIGDELPENYEQTFCGRCNASHGSRDPSGIVDAPSSAYATKSRRPRETKSPTFYELPDQSQEKFSSDYSRSPSRYQSRRPADRFTEKSKRSLHASRGTARTLPRYVE